jgi:hypothetical protein
MSHTHDIDIKHHHCTECGGVMTTAGSAHPQCEARANIELEVAAFKERRRIEDEKEEEEQNARRSKRSFRR